ncbi:glycosyltransferase family 4 protein [Salinivibrio kushneri]|uniref:glycosyltransferase family 4 protein n=1 Tax=Salinivibrio kushneri TaxID=1908198 RepID=UPI0022B3543E|nr:glycosyltransferase [Salinivibrio kushneri]WBA17144.1 glycosyltransferase [Salinivibrio kushneri]
MKKVLHIITGLSDGGAEAVLYRLCHHDKENQNIVISLMNKGKYGSLLEDMGVQVYCLGMRAGKIRFSALIKLYNLIRQVKPDVVQTWMYHADLIGGVVARLAGVKNVFWNIRHTELKPNESKRSTILIAKACAKISSLVPKRIVCCANKAASVHVDLGYAGEKMIVIGNGYDLSLFYPKRDCGSSLSDSNSNFLLGMVGRFNPQKDHVGLLKALDIVKKKRPGFKVFLIGKDINSSNLFLRDNINTLGLEGHVSLLDQREDIATIMNSLDIHILSSSFGEGFPNVVSEAMACGTPCVTTDVGDAAFIVGQTGWVVPPKKPHELASAIVEAIDEKQNSPQAWQARKKACRQRIVENFSIDKMVENYHQVWFS